MTDSSPYDSPSSGLLRPGDNVWRMAMADQAALIVDAADYFRLIRQAMLAAHEQILMIGWDFDTRIHLDGGHRERGEVPARLGRFLTWLAQRRPELDIHILKWDLGALKLLGRGTTLTRIAGWVPNKQIHFRLDGVHPHGASHHHKIVVIDDSFAVCGGIDMTGARWDTRDHRDDDPRRRRPTGRTYGPWHDATMAVSGDAAKALGELGRKRWQVACGETIAPPSGPHPIWPEELRPQFRNASLGIARTRAETPNLRKVREIERLVLDLIASAKRYVYVETQYFASRAIAEAIEARLAEDDGPEFLIVNPKAADGWLEEAVMGPARAELMTALARVDRRGRFRIYTPVTAGGADIYVHAKIMIVDDRVLRIGSANMNNRSMGLDSECDLVLDSRLPDNQGAETAIAAIRNDLMAEHLGVDPGRVAEVLGHTGSLLATVEALRGEGRSLRPFVPPDFAPALRQAARAQALDPESGGGTFEPPARPGLLGALRRRFRRRAVRSAAAPS